MMYEALFLKGSWSPEETAWFFFFPQWFGRINYMSVCIFSKRDWYSVSAKTLVRVREIESKIVHISCAVVSCSMFDPFPCVLCLNGGTIKK